MPIEAHTFSGFDRRAQLGGLRLFLEAQHPVVVVDFHDAEAGHLAGIDLDGGQGHVGAGLVVPLQHQAVIHLVDVVAGEDQHVLGLLRPDRVNVLIHRVGGALVPLIAYPLHRRQHFDELAHLAAHDVPAFAHVAVQRKRLVLGQDINPAQVGVDAVGKSDVDDAIDSAEGDSRLGAIASERIEALARPAR